MKKLLLLCSMCFLLSCSNSDDSNGSSNQDFNPPAWIQGDWKQENDLGIQGVLFNFYAHDFCFTNLGTVKQCQQQMVNLYRNQSNAVSVTENITATTYTAEITYFGGQSTIFSFKKLGTNQFEWTAVPGAVFTKQ